MRNTAPTPVRQRPVTAEGLSDWASYEVIPSLTELRRAANYTSREIQEATTDGAGTYATIWKSDVMRTGVVWGLQADIVGMSVSLSLRASYVIRGLFYNNGTIFLQGGVPTYVAVIESDPFCDARFAIDAASGKVTVEVRDDGLTAMTYEAIVDWREFPHP